MAARTVCRESRWGSSTTVPTSSAGRSSASGRSVEGTLAAAVELRRGRGRQRAWRGTHRCRRARAAAGRALRHDRRSARRASGCSASTRICRPTSRFGGFGRCPHTSMRAVRPLSRRYRYTIARAGRAPRACAPARLVAARAARLRSDDGRGDCLARRARLLGVSRCGLPGEIADAPTHGRAIARRAARRTLRW